MRTRRGSDSGFTLTEMLVVLVLLSVVLSATYAASQAIMAGGRVNEMQAAFARDSGEPMRIINKSLMQATNIEVALPYQIQVTTDRDLDNVLERMRVTASSDGKLTYEYWRNGAAPPAVPSNKIAWSTSCSNVSLGVPLFTYYGIAGSTQTELASPTNSLAAKLVVTDLRLSFDGTNFRSQQSALLRNRQ